MTSTNSRHAGPSDLVFRVGRVTARLKRRAIVTNVVCVAVIVAVSIFAITLGSYPITVGDIVNALSGTADERVTRIVLEWRAPRIVAAVLFGAALAIGGAIFQSITRNPLGSPDIIGFTTGSYTGVIVMLLSGMSSYVALAIGALVGGLVIAFAVYLLAFKRGIQGFRFIVVGIALGAFLAAINSWFSVKADLDVSLRAAVWGAGSLSIVTWTSIGLASIVLLVVLVASPPAQRRMRALELGDDAAAMLGVSVERVKMLLIVLGVAATALVTAAAGPISFVALAAPQISRRITGRGQEVDLLGSALVGAAILLIADIVAQHAIPNISLPTGAVTVCLGGAYLVWLLARESRRDARGQPL